MYLANVKNIPIGVVGSKSMILLDSAANGLATGASGQQMQCGLDLLHQPMFVLLLGQNVLITPM
jgi:hypothetical protein